MKKTIVYVLVLLTITACNSDTKDSESTSENKEVVEAPKVTQPAQLADVPWAAILDSTSQIISMTKTEEVKDEDLNVANVAEALNRKYPDIFITDPTIKNDTVFVKIKDATYLTQGTGSMGAKIFLAESTYSFTQIPGVAYVNYDFKIGDHASPGTFTRTNFDFKK